MRISRTVVVAAVVLAAATSMLAVTWTGPYTVTTDTLFPYRCAMNNAWGVQAYENDGTGNDVVHVAYWNDTDGLEDVHYLRSLDNGQNWSEAFDISDPTDEDNASQPAVAVYGGDWDNHEVCVAWYDEDGDDEQIFSVMSRRNDSCGEHDDHWRSSEYRSGWTSIWDEECLHPSAATSAGPNGKYYLHVVWDDYHDDELKSVIWYDNALYDPDDIQSYGSYRSQVTSDDGYEDLSPSIAAAWVEGMITYSAYLHVVFYGKSSADTLCDEVWYVRSLNTGSSWSSPVNISNTTGHESQAPSIAISGANVYVVWQEADPSDGRFRIWFRRSTDMGSSWGSTQPIPDSLLPLEDQNQAPECFTPSVACYRDNVYITCQAGWDSYGVLFIASSDNGSTWTAEGLGGETDDYPDLDAGIEGLFPTVSVSQGVDSANKFISVLYSGFDENEDYRVYWLRGNNIDVMPGDGAGSTNELLARRVRMDVQPTVMRDMANVRLKSSMPGPYSVAVYDASGQRVRTLHGILSGSGAASIVWDGTGDDGCRVAAGTYLLRLQSGGSAATRRVQVLAR